MLQSIVALLQDTRREAPTLAQLPARAPDRWLALALEPGAPRPPSGRVALAAWISGNRDFTQPLTGLLLDEWPEQIPSTGESTGVAFHYQAPTARAPQALLMAVHPDPGRGWRDATLLATLNETLELAKARTVDLDTLQELGQLLPALYVPFNADGETVSFFAQEIP